MKKIKLVLLALVILGTSVPAMAGVDALAFKDQAQEQRYRKLAEELRCLVCQNQSLADSNADLAHDLRVELLRQINQDKSDQEIIDYLVSRYGDFVRYKPALKESTWLLWFGPFLILLAALFAAMRVMRSRDHAEATQAISTAEAERLQALLKDNNKKDENKDR